MLNVKFPSAIYQALLTKANNEKISIPTLIVRIVTNAVKAGL